jgi:hypothetical protein
MTRQELDGLWMNDIEAFMDAIQGAAWPRINAQLEAAEKMSVAGIQMTAALFSSTNRAKTITQQEAQAQEAWSAALAAWEAAQ